MPSSSVISQGTLQASRTRIGITCAIPVIVFIVVYGRTAGLGFISDDFGWIEHSRFRSAGDVLRPFVQNPGFYRPLVSLSFAANFIVFDMRPRGYGVTNLALALACAALIFFFLRCLDVRKGAAWLGACVWLFNFHGINMGILWNSGRTALLLVAFSVAAALMVLTRRFVFAMVFFAAALLSKEEAVLLPAMLLASSMCAGSRATGRIRSDEVLLAIGCGIVLLFYFVLREHAGAMTPASAPFYYRFTIAPSVVGRNMLEYLDRACTVAAAVTLAAWALLRPDNAFGHVRKRVLVLAATWYAAGHAITTFLPVRSSLYACLPSIGPAIAAAEICGSLWASALPRARRRALIAAMCAPVLFAPVYQSRTHRWADLAKYSQRVLDSLPSDSHAIAEGSWIVLVDHDRDKRVNVQSAFGSLIGDAISLKIGRKVNVWVETALPTAEIAGMTPPCADCARRTYDVNDGLVSER